MTFNQENKYEKSLRKKNCAICRKSLEENSVLQVQNMATALICERCKIRFTKEDVEHIIYIFEEYGGFFGQFKKEKLSLEDLIRESLKSISIKRDGINIFEKNLTLRYNALLYGFTPQELIEQLRDLGC